MMTTYECSDIIHIMKMSRVMLSDSDSARLEFSGQVSGKNYWIIILIVEDLPRVSMKLSGATVFEDTVKSVDDLKIFLEERLYKYLEV